MRDTPIIVHVTTDAAIDNLLIRFNFICATAFLRPSIAHQMKPESDFHISLLRLGFIIFFPS